MTNITCDLVFREHIREDASMANLLCNQISRLDHDLGEKTGVLGGSKISGGRKQAKGGRCGLHGLDNKHPMTVTNWMETWDLMEAECREEAVLLPSSLVRAALDSHLKRHKFCCDCSAMVRKAFQYLLESGRVSQVIILIDNSYHDLCSCCRSRLNLLERNVHSI